jgi:argininosuccinate lyase
MMGGQVDPKTSIRSGGIQVNALAMKEAALKGYATATDLADYLVRKGLPFRDAHEAVAKIVRLAQDTEKGLSDLPIAQLKTIHPFIDEDVYNVLTLEGSLNARATLGGTAPVQIRMQIERWKKLLEKGHL